MYRSEIFRDFKYMYVKLLIIMHKSESLKITEVEWNMQR